MEWNESHNKDENRPYMMCLVWVSERVNVSHRNCHGYQWRQTPVAGAVIHTVFCEVPSEAEESAFKI